MSFFHCFLSVGFLFVGVLFEDLNDALKYLGAALDDVCDLTDGIGCGGFTDVYHVHLALGADNQKAYGNDGKSGAATAAKILRGGLFLLAEIVDSTRSKAYGYLGYGDDCYTAGGNVRIADDSVGVYHGAHIFKGCTDDLFDLVFISHEFSSFPMLFI